MAHSWRSIVSIEGEIRETSVKHFTAPPPPPPPPHLHRGGHSHTHTRTHSTAKGTAPGRGNRTIFMARNIAPHLEHGLHGLVPVGADGFIPPDGSHRPCPNAPSSSAHAKQPRSKTATGAICRLHGRGSSTANKAAEPWTMMKLTTGRAPDREPGRRPRWCPFWRSSTKHWATSLARS